MDQIDEKSDTPPLETGTPKEENNQVVVLLQSVLSVARRESLQLRCAK